MTAEITCKVKDALVQELLALNNKLNTLSPDLLHSEEAHARVQERREALYIKRGGRGDSRRRAPERRDSNSRRSAYWRMLAGTVKLVFLRGQL
jgi:hypothetical protein